MTAGADHRPDPPEVVTKGATGRLTSRGGDRWPVRVAQHSGDVLLLVLMLQGDEKGFGEYEIDPLVLECASAYGLARFEGEAALEDHDLLRFRAFSDAEVIQRRRHVRLRAEQPVEFLMPRTGIPVKDVRAVDISGGGMLLEAVANLTVGDRIKFQLHLDRSAPPIKGIGRIVRAGPEEQRALVFERIAKNDRERLIHFIFARERQQRASAHGKR